MGITICETGAELFEQHIQPLPILGLVRAVCLKHHFPPLSLFLPLSSAFPAPVRVWHQMVPALNTAAVYCWVITSSLSQNIIIITAPTGALQQQPLLQEGTEDCKTQAAGGLSSVGSFRKKPPQGSPLGFMVTVLEAAQLALPVLTCHTSRMPKGSMLEGSGS